MALIVVVITLLFLSNGASADPALEVVMGEDTRHITRDALLGEPDTTTVEIADDISYGKPMSYRAVPLASLLTAKIPAGNVIEAVATDGFAAQLPLHLIMNTDPGKPIAWLAIEPADKAWPPLPGKAESAGPFYIVWTGPAAGTIRSEQWPYQVAKLASQPAPAARWPALAVDPT